MIVPLYHLTRVDTAEGFREIEFLRALPERQARTTDGEAEMLIHRWFCHCEKYWDTLRNLS